MVHNLFVIISTQQTNIYIYIFMAWFNEVGLGKFMQSLTYLILLINMDWFNEYELMHSYLAD